MMMNAANTAPPTMAASHHAPPPGRQHRPRRKSLEQLEAKYKALMRNMLMYQQLRKRNLGGGAGTGVGAGTSIKTEAAGTGVGMDEKSQQHLIYQAQQTLPTPSSSVSPASSTTNLEDSNISKQSQPQQQGTYQHHQNPTSALREQQRERPSQKRLQNASSGPKSAYDRREAGSSARHARPAGRTMPAAMQLAYEELASIQRHQTPAPQQQQQHHHQQQQQPHHQQQPPFQQSTQQTQQQHQGSAPIPIPRPANIQIPPHYLQQQYMHHVSPHIHGHHQPLASPIPTPPHLTASYTAHHNLPTMSAPYASYDTSGMPTNMDQHRQHQQQQPPHHHPHPSGMPAFAPNDPIEGDLLDCFVSNMGDM
ncbi:hypothetical protein FHL15_005253 [Xylaria flabelliformis]|uniref:Uncharacterized protein n=1 Tax=Xylaria flabelliformis TaxID=2512241 RepID=A0A553I113_9PEZI|nr:hypothetical protein FHL15_005253 [Xylaria flabelliformis]